MTRTVPVGPRSPEWRERFRGQFAKTRLCRFSSGVKTSLCTAWEKGSCTVASQFCPFAHGESELRATLAFAEQPLSRKLRTLSGACNAQLPPKLPVGVVLNSKASAVVGPNSTPDFGTGYADQDQRLLHAEQYLRQRVAPGVRSSAEAPTPGWVLSCGSGQASTDDTSSSRGDCSDDTKGQQRCRRGRRSVEGMLRRKERHERHRLMVSSQKEGRVDQADYTTLSAAALGRAPAKAQPPAEIVIAPEPLTQATRWGMPLAPETTPIAADAMSMQTQAPGPEFYYMQPQMQSSVYQQGVGAGMGCPFKAWEVEGILRSAMPQQYED